MQNNAQEKLVAEQCAWIRDYCARRVNFAVMDDRRTMSPHLVLDLGRQGLLGMSVSRAYGGAESSATHMVEVLRCLGGIDATLALFVGLTNVIGARPIMLGGSDALKARVLPEIASGRMLAAFALTEPHAGSNPGALTAVARRSGSDWELSGVKWLSGLGAWSGVVNAFFRTPSDAGGPGPISGFCVSSDSAGLSQGPEAMTMGMRAMIQNEIRFDRVRAADDELLGAHGRGLQIAQDGMGWGRLAIAAAAGGAIGKCLAIAQTYAEGRRIGTGRLAEHPHTRSVLAQVAASRAGLDYLVGVVARAIDAGAPPTMEVLAVCKVIGSEEAFRASDLCLQVLGGRGYLETEEIARVFRDTRVLRIFEGPSEALLHFVGGAVQRNSGSLDELLAILGDEDGPTMIRDTICNFGAPGVRGGPARRQAQLAFAYLLGELVCLVVHCAAARAAHPAASPGVMILEDRRDLAAQAFGLRLRRLCESAQAPLAASASWSAPDAAPYEEQRASQLLIGLDT